MGRKLLIMICAFPLLILSIVSVSMAEDFKSAVQWGYVYVYLTGESPDTIAGQLPDQFWMRTFAFDYTD